MGEARLPPRYANIPTWLLYEVDLPRSVLVTAMRIFGLGWRYNYERTGPVSMDRLCAWCGVGRSQLYGHLQHLVGKDMLRYISTGDVFVFDLRPVSRGVALSPEIRTGSTLSVVDVSDSDSDSESKLKQQQGNSGSGGESEGGAGESGFPDWVGRLEALDRIGVLEPTRTELMRLAWAGEAYLEEWADWFEVAREGAGVGMVVVQVRAGVRAPALGREEQVRLDVRRRWEGVVSRSRANWEG